MFFALRAQNAICFFALRAQHAIFFFALRAQNAKLFFALRAQTTKCFFTLRAQNEKFSSRCARKIQFFSSHHLPLLSAIGNLIHQTNMWMCSKSNCHKKHSHKMRRRGSKMIPRSPQEIPKCNQDRPKRAPRQTQHPKKQMPKCL